MAERERELSLQLGMEWATHSQTPGLQSRGASRQTWVAGYLSSHSPAGGGPAETPLSGGLWKKKALLQRTQGLGPPNCTKGTRRVSGSPEGGRLPILKLRARMGTGMRVAQL